MIYFAAMRYMFRSEAVARWSVLSLFFLVPAFFLPVSWLSIVQGKMLLGIFLATVGFLACIVAALNESRLRISTSPLLFATALVPLAYLASALASGAPWESFFGLSLSQDTVMGAVVWYMVLFLAANILSQGTDRTLRAMRLLLAGGSFVLLIQALHLFVPSLTFGGALPIGPSSIIGSWHDLGIFLALVTFISLALFNSKVELGYWRYVAGVNALAAFLMLAIINYADIWVGLAALSIFFSFFVYRTREQGGSLFRFSGGITPWLILAALAVGFYFAGSSIHASLPSRLQVTQIEVRPSWQGTLEIGQKVFAEPSRIFFGSGPSTFSREWGFYKPLSVNTTQFWNIDFYSGVGFVPTSLVTTGVLGLIAWGAVCAALLWIFVRWLARGSAATLVHTIALGSAVFLAAFHILYVPGVSLSLLTFLFFGALIAEERLLSGREWGIPLSWASWKGRFAAALLMLLGLIVLFGSVQSLRVLVSDVLVNRASAVYAATQDPQLSSESIARALFVLPNNDKAHRAGVELGLQQLARMLSEAGTDEDARVQLQATLDSTIQHGLEAVSIEDRNYQNWFSLARLYGELAGVGVEGAEASARQAYAAVLQNNPTSPLPYVGVAQLDIAKGDDATARTNLESALKLKPDLAVAHFLLSQIYARAGDLQKATEHGVAIVQLVPQDPLGFYNLGTILYAGRDYANAAVVFERAVSLQNNYSDAIFLLALSYYQLERVSDALAMFKLVSALNPDAKNVTELITTIEAGKDIRTLVQ